MDFTFWLSLFVFGIVSIISSIVASGHRKLGSLSEVELRVGMKPKVSIIVSALNEADTIESALLSMLAIDYPNFEIIAINDRSTDSTPTILNRLAASNDRLRVIHIDELPSGWLGKCHALYKGALTADGDYIIFTDADIHFERSAVARAVFYCEQYEVAHLTLLLRLIAKTNLLKMMLVGFTVAMYSRFKPWKVSTSHKHFLGIGGFNLIRRDAYLTAGGHAAIPMAVLDDLMLGKLMKSKGFVQHVLSASELISVEWYRNTPELIRGLQKNIFAAFDYELSKLVFASLAIILFRLWPWVGLVFTSEFTWCLCLMTLLVGFALYADLLKAFKWNLRALWFAPISGIIDLYIWWRGSLLVLWKGGVEWRGTFYSINDLKKDLTRL